MQQWNVKQLGIAVVIAIVVLFAMGNMWSIGSGLYKDFAFLRLARTQYDQQVAQQAARQAAAAAQQQARRPSAPAAPAAPAESAAKE